MPDLSDLPEEEEIEAIEAIEEAAAEEIEEEVEAEENQIEAVAVDEKIGGAPWVAIIGGKGVGKSRLAGILDKAFCLDTEGGAGSAFKSKYRKEFTYGVDMFDKVVAFVTGMASAKREGKLWVGKSVSISALVIDTYDALQELLITKYLEPKNRPSWAPPGLWAPSMDQQDWGSLLSLQRPLVMELKALKMPVVWNFHATMVDPIYKGSGNKQQLIKQGVIRPAVAGGIKNSILNLCDYVLYIEATQNGERIMYTQPTVLYDHRLDATDRHNLFVGKGFGKFPLPAKDGWPTRNVLQYILDHHDY